MSYERIDHFKETLAQLQGKNDPGIIPEDILRKILMEGIYIKRVIAPIPLNHDMMRNVLREHDYTSFVEHIPFFMSQLDAPVLTLTPEIENSLLQMFQKITDVWSQCHEPHRPSFLNYNYVLFKSLESMFPDVDRVGLVVPMLKNKERLKNYDKRWQKVCQLLNLPYIPTTALVHD